MPQFKRYIGIDYSGAATPDSSLSGLSVYLATPQTAAIEVLPPPGPRKYWTRRGVAEWLAAELKVGELTVVGIDHSFSFPHQYSAAHAIPLDWPTFLADFHQHWPTDQHSVESVRRGEVGSAALRDGNARWRRVAEIRCRAKSVFHFDVQGSVAKSSHAGIPWIGYLRQQLGSRLHCWPYDGWLPAAGCSVLVEAYPALCSRNFPRQDRNEHQHDAYSVASWMRQCDAAHELAKCFTPELSAEIREMARYEGWVLGVL